MELIHYIKSFFRRFISNKTKGMNPINFTVNLEYQRFAALPTNGLSFVQFTVKNSASYFRGNTYVTKYPHQLRESNKLGKFMYSLYHYHKITICVGKKRLSNIPFNNKVPTVMLGSFSTDIKRNLRKI